MIRQGGTVVRRYSRGGEEEEEEAKPAELVRNGKQGGPGQLSRVAAMAIVLRRETLFS
jgi:hypothetical protein